MKSVISGGFFLVCSCILAAASIISKNGNSFIDAVITVMGIIGIVQIVIGLFFEDD